jgi:hypothetical protein
MSEIDVLIEIRDQMVFLNSKLDFIVKYLRSKVHVKQVDLIQLAESLDLPLKEVS